MIGDKDVNRQQFVAVKQLQIIPSGVAKSVAMNQSFKANNSDNWIRWISLLRR
jgi:hypothetical protein